MLTATYIIVSIIIFYGLIIWFLHKASARFHKMDEKVGNIESSEATFTECSIVSDNISNEKKQNEEEQIKEKQEIYQESMPEL